MEATIPSAQEVREALAPLNLRQLAKLARMSGVPEATIYKIKLGDTENPGIETVRRFMGFISEAREAA